MWFCLGYEGRYAPRLHGHSTVYSQNLAGNVAGIGAHEKPGDASDVGGLPEGSERDALKQLLDLWLTQVAGWGSTQP